MINEYGEIVEILNSKDITIERITSLGKTTNFMESKIDEIVYLLEGNAELEIENKKITLNKGDIYRIYKNTKHKVTYTSNDCKWLCIYLGENL